MSMDEYVSLKTLGNYVTSGYRRFNYYVIFVYLDRAKNMRIGGLGWTMS
jgi:hypothetical protein